MYSINEQLANYPFGKVCLLRITKPPEEYSTFFLDHPSDCVCRSSRTRDNMRIETHYEKHVPRILSLSCLSSYLKRQMIKH